MSMRARSWRMLHACLGMYEPLSGASCMGGHVLRIRYVASARQAGKLLTLQYIPTQSGLCQAAGRITN